jgi:putative ABC transport system substrate-binding protein
VALQRIGSVAAEAIARWPSPLKLEGGGRTVLPRFSTEHARTGVSGGRDYAVEVRYADGDASRLPSLAEELVGLKPDVIVATSTPGALAAKQVTASIPIVGVNMTDPVGFGLVTSEARPGAM